MKAAQHGKTMLQRAIEGERPLIVVSSNRVADRALRELHKAAPSAKIEPENRILRFPSGGFVKVISASPEFRAIEAVRGLEFSDVEIDPACTLSAYAIEVISSRVRL